jgi:hypothetical protein
LQPVLAGNAVKVTSRKEAVRLLGELRAPGASAVLTETWSGAHRDVRAAIARTVSQYLLYDPAAWAVLEQAVHDSAATAAALTARRAYDVPVAYRSRYADLLIAVTTRSEPEVVGPALLALREWARFNPAGAGVCADFISRLPLRSRVWRDAIAALVSIVATDPPAGLEELVDAVRLLVRLEADPSLPNALPDRDHPARQRLTDLVGQLCAQFSHRSADVRRHLTAVADELTASDFLDLRLQLLVLAQDDFDHLRGLVADDPLAAQTAADLVCNRLTTTEPDPTVLLPTAEALVNAPDLASGLLAHAYLGTAGPRSGWSPEWRSLLVALRNHPVPAIRRRALSLTTATE